MDEKTLQSLRTAVASGRTDIVRSFIGNNTMASAATGGQKVNTVDPKLASLVNNVHPEQGTMLHMASKLGNADVVRALLVSGADPSIKDEQGQNAVDIAPNPQVKRVFFDVLLQAVAQSNITLATNILSAGIDVNGSDDEFTGNTALHYAASYGNGDMVKLLLERKADINKTNADGATPLHDAVSRGDAEVVEVFIEEGADTSIQATKGKFKGKSAVDIAAETPIIKSIVEKLPPPLANGHAVITEVNGETSEDSKSDTASFVDKGDTASDAGSIHATSDTGPNTPQTTPDVDQISESLLSTRIQSAPEVNVVMDTKLQLLWPRPQRIIENDGPVLDLGSQFCIQLETDQFPATLQRMVDIWSVHISLLSELGYNVIMESGTESNTPLPRIVCQICPHLFPRHSEAYRLTVTSGMIKIHASDFSGLWYAACTLNQLIRLCRADGIPQLHITDWPDLPYRGVALDLSAGRIPKLEHLMYLINIISFQKYNQLHMYFKLSLDGTFENTMPYPQSDILELDIYCKWRFMKLIPHIDLDRDATITTKEIMLFRQLLSCFPSSPFVNLGPNLTRRLIETEHPDFDSPSPFTKSMTMHNKLMMMGVRESQVALFCSNELKTENAELVLPSGSIFMHYGSKMDCDFEGPGKQLTAHGQCFYVCPGTAAWNSFGGFPEAAIGNIFQAVRCASVYPSAIGILVTDWAGHTYINQPTISWPAFVTAAGVSWNRSSDMEFLQSKLPELINTHVFLDGNLVLGQALIELGRVETFLSRAVGNQLKVEPVNLPPEKGSFTCSVMLSPDDVNLEYITPEVIQKAIRHLRKCNNVLSQVPRSAVNDFAIAELQVTADFLLWACRLVRALILAGKKPDSDIVGAPVINVGLNNVPITAKTDLANKLLELIERYRQIWMMTSHPGSIAEGIAFFMKILHQLVPQKAAVVTAH